MKLGLRALFVAGSSCLAVSTALPARGAERPITFADAMTLAETHPRVQGGRRAAADLAQAERASPYLDANPVLALAAGPRVAPRAERGFEGAAELTQSIGLDHQASRRQQALGAESAWLSAECDAELLARRLGTAAAWLALWEAEEQVAVALKDVANEEELVRLVGRLASVRERTTADVAVVETRLAEAQLRERTAEGALAEARSQLAAELRASEGDVLVASGAPPDLSAPPPEEQARVLAAAVALPAVRAKELLARTELVRAEEERASRGARLTFGVEVRHDALRADVVEGMLAVPLSIFAVGAREYASRAASSVRAAGEASDEQSRARAAVTLALHEVEHTEEVFTLLQTSLVPAAERATLLRERQLKMGDGTLLEVIDARRTMLDARVRLVRATRERAWARIQIHLLAEATRGGH